MLDGVGKDLTGATFGDVINGGWGYEPEGDPAGLGPIEYPAGHSEPAPCSALVRIEKAAYVPVQPIQCFENLPIDEVPTS
jgi:hypothetical protein